MRAGAVVAETGHRRRYLPLACPADSTRPRRHRTSAAPQQPGPLDHRLSLHLWESLVRGRRCWWHGASPYVGGSQRLRITFRPVFWLLTGSASTTSSTIAPAAVSHQIDRIAGAVERLDGAPALRHHLACRQPGGPTPVARHPPDPDVAVASGSCIRFPDLAIQPSAD